MAAGLHENGSSGRTSHAANDAVGHDGNDDYDTLTELGKIVTRVRLVVRLGCHPPFERRYSSAQRHRSGRDRVRLGIRQQGARDSPDVSSRDVDVDAGASRV